MRWRVVNGQPVIKYKEAIARPTWGLMEKLAGMGKDERRAEIHRIMKENKKETRNMYSAYNIFTDCVKLGEISMRVDNSDRNIVNHGAGYNPLNTFLKRFRSPEEYRPKVIKIIEMSRAGKNLDEIYEAVKMSPGHINSTRTWGRKNGLW